MKLIERSNLIEDSSSTELISARPALGTRLIETISCRPDSDSNLPKLRQLFLVALGVILLLAVATFFTNSWYEAIALSPLPLRVFNIAFTLIAIAAIPFVSRRHWRLWAMGYSLVMIVSFTLASLAVHDEEPLFVAFLFLLLDTSVLVPWGGRWQCGLALMSLVCFSLISVAGLILTQDIPSWLALELVGALSVSLASLKVYLSRQRGLIGDLQLGEEALREENSQRNLAEQRLRKEIVERETAATLARKREAILRRVLETSLDIVAITRLADLTYIYANDRFSEIPATPSKKLRAEHRHNCISLPTPSGVRNWRRPYGETVARTISSSTCAPNRGKSCPTWSPQGDGDRRRTVPSLDVTRHHRA
jgi:PAS domain-containing protein